MRSHKGWFITGSSRGFGCIWAKAALERGDQVVATAGNAGDLKDLAPKHSDAVLALDLNVDDRTAIFAAFTIAEERFGRIDVVLNNAGYGRSAKSRKSAKKPPTRKSKQTYERLVRRFGVSRQAQDRMAVCRPYRVDRD